MVRNGAKPVSRRWSGFCVVAASGPSLTEDDANLCRHHRVLAVGDAYKLFPWAEVLYACDSHWWDIHNGVPDFRGEKWISTDGNRWTKVLSVAKQYRLRIVAGNGQPFFSFDQKCIHYGRNSGFQGTNLALLFGATTIALVGFDYRNINGKSHFFGQHPKPLANTTDFKQWIEHMQWASKKLPSHIKIFNCTPDSAIDCFERRELKEVLDGVADCHATY